MTITETILNNLLYRANQIGDLLTDPPRPHPDASLMRDAATEIKRLSKPTPKDGLIEASSEVKSYLEDVIGVVTANSYEMLCLWQEYKDRGHPWVSTGHGYGPAIGHFSGMPVCLSLLTATVKGHKILFIEPTSSVVDWRIIEEWLNKNLPKSAFRENGSYNETNAMNFHNIFPRKQVNNG